MHAVQHLQYMATASQNVNYAQQEYQERVAWCMGMWRQKKKNLKSYQKDLKHAKYVALFLKQVFPHARLVLIRVDWNGQKG